MASVVHVVTTSKLAGVERYACTTANETAARGWEVTLIGGNPELVPAELDGTVRWLPGSTVREVLTSFRQLGRQDVCHAHMTLGEGLAVVGRPLHRAPIVSTRHFAAVRGSTRMGRLAAPWIGRGLTRQVAMSQFVAEHLEQPPDAVVLGGVSPSPLLWRPESLVVLVLQRLESEKDTMTALRAWGKSRLADEGWSLRVVGDGMQRAALESWATQQRLASLSFCGWTADVKEQFAEAGLLLAPAPTDSFGLAVVEAMAAGVPVVACGAGGHLETVGRLSDAPSFPPHDAEAAASALRLLAEDKRRRALSSAGRKLVEEKFTASRHVDRLLVEYEAALHSRATARGGRHASAARAERS